MTRRPPASPRTTSENSKPLINDPKRWLSAESEKAIPLYSSAIEFGRSNHQNEPDLKVHGFARAPNRWMWNMSTDLTFAADQIRPETLIAPNLQQKRLLKRFVVAFVAFVGLIVVATFTMAVLAAAPAPSEAPQLPNCERDISAASAGVAAMQARLKSLGGVDESEICTATRLYFLEVVKARAVTALCKSGIERDREIDRLNADVDHANEAIAARCL